MKRFFLILSAITICLLSMDHLNNPPTKAQGKMAVVSAKDAAFDEIIGKARTDGEAFVIVGLHISPKNSVVCTEEKRLADISRAQNEFLASFAIGAMAQTPAPTPSPAA